MHPLHDPSDGARFEVLHAARREDDGNEEVKCNFEKSEFRWKTGSASCKGSILQGLIGKRPQQGGRLSCRHKRAWVLIESCPRTEIVADMCEFNEEAEHY